MKKLLFVFVTLLLLLVIPGCNNNKDTYSIDIDEPSDMNLPMPLYRDFYVSGNIKVNGEDGVLPEGVNITVRLFDKEDNEVRYVHSLEKGTYNLYFYHDDLYYPYDEEEQDRTSLAGSVSAPLFVVRDLSDPMASYQDASIKCIYDDNSYRALITCATDAAHGLLFDNNIGLTNPDGSPINGLEEGDYKIVVNLVSANGKVLAEASKDMHVGGLTDSIIGRLFNPKKHYEKLLAWQKKNNFAINVDWLPGYVKTSDGQSIGHRGMFNNNDLAVYAQTKAHMLMYLIEPTSSSFRLELSYLEYANRINENDFVAWHYDIGEPELNIPSKNQVLQGEIVQFDKLGSIEVCRVDEVSFLATDLIFNSNGNNTFTTHTDTKNKIVIENNAKIAFAGAISPYQIDGKYVTKDRNNAFTINELPQYLIYTFDNGHSFYTETKQAVIIRTNDQERGKASICLYEFYNVFDASLFMLPGEECNVHICVYSAHGELIEGMETDLVLVGKE